MSMLQSRPCPCGSGEHSWPEHDAQGIYLCRVCEKCEKEKLSQFRPEILSGYSQEDVDEPIESEDSDWQHAGEWHED